MGPMTLMFMGGSPRCPAACALAIALTLTIVADASPILGDVGGLLGVEEAELVEAPATNILHAARKASIEDDKGVADSEDKKKAKSDAAAANLSKLKAALKDAAVAVSEKAASVAAAKAMKPGLAKLKVVEAARVSYEKSEMAAKALADAAHGEVLNDRKAVVAALKAEASAAKSKDTRNKAVAMHLRDRLATKHATAKKAAQDAKKAAKKAAQHKAHQSVHALEKKMAARADAAERKEAQVRAAAAKAKVAMEKAAQMKDRALSLQKRRGTVDLAKQAKKDLEAMLVEEDSYEEEDW